MKSTFFFFLRLASVMPLLLSCATVFSQKTTTWKGGAPGMEYEWNCPKNWSGGAIPNEFSNVVIPDVATTTHAAPVIQSGQVTVNALYLHSNALLTIGSKAELVILETAEGINTSTILLKGKLSLPEETRANAQIAVFKPAPH